jgi:very-short-patch-repair endonuclease
MGAESANPDPDAAVPRIAARDAHLATLGYEVVRFTWRQLAEDAAIVVRTIRSLLENTPPPNL